MKKIRLVLCGCGHRGIGMIKMISGSIAEYEILAACDPYIDKAESLQKDLKELHNIDIKVYAEHEKMFDELKPDAVLVAANWETHVEIAICAMRKGIAVAMEVGGAYSEEECSALVKAYEETKTPFMFMENCCFNDSELFATAVVRSGMLGKIVYCHGAYGHDLREEISYGDFNRHYRLRNYTNRNCENYPTHEIGPIAKLLGINRGNRMVSLVSKASPACGLHEYVQDKEELAYLKDREFKQGDIVETLITCENGELINLRLDTTLPRFYSREFTVRGTQGLYLQEPNMLLVQGQFDETLGLKKFYNKYMDNAKEYYDKFLPDMWKNVTEEILQAGHGGMDYFEFVVFADCLLNNKEMPIDVYDAAAWMSIAYLSEQSIRENRTVAIPDFTNGRYKERAIQDVIELPKPTL